MNQWRDDAEILCHCRGVTAGTVRRCVVELRPKDAAAVGPACRAGTGCKSCWPDIETVIAQERRARGGPFAWLRRLIGAGRP